MRHHEFRSLTILAGPCAGARSLAGSGRRWRHFGLMATLVVLVLGQPGRSEAALRKYTLTGGTFTGTLNGVGFTDKAFTIEAIADPVAQIVTGSTTSSQPYRSFPTTSTITIADVGSTVFSNPNFGPAAIDQSGTTANLSTEGFVDFTTNPGTARGFYVSNLVPAFDLLSPGSITGVMAISGTDFATSAGTLHIASFNPNISTFSVTAVPEPSTYALIGLAALAMGGRTYWSRRRSLCPTVGSLDSSSAC